MREMNSKCDVSEHEQEDTNTCFSTVTHVYNQTSISFTLCLPWLKNESTTHYSKLDVFKMKCLKRANLLHLVSMESRLMKKIYLA